MPGRRIERPGAVVNVYDRGSVYGPIEGQSTVVGGYDALVGVVEDGIGARIELGDCGVVDLIAYGVGEQEFSLILDAAEFATT